jgi:hypothetical protein
MDRDSVGPRQGREPAADARGSDARSARQARRGATLVARVWPPSVRAALRRARTRPPAKPKPEAPTLSPRRYRFNLILLIAATVLALVWFDNHLRLYVTGIRILSGTMTAWGLWKLVQSGFHWGGVEGKPLAQRALGTGWATETLAFAVILLVVLNLTTSSLYLDYDDPRRAAEVVVQVSSGQRPLLAPLTVHPYDTVVGRPFFLRWRGERLSFEVQRPRGYLRREADLLPGRSLHMRVPLEFERKRFVVLCLAPGLSMFNELPRAGDPSDVTYSVRLSRQGQQWEFADVRRNELLCTGAGADDLKAEFEARDRDAFRGRLGALYSQTGLPPDRVDERVRLAEAGVRFGPSGEFAAKDQVVIEVRRGTETASGPRPLPALGADALQQVLY